MGKQGSCRRQCSLYHTGKNPQRRQKCKSICATRRKYKEHIPVLVDDIVSTGNTMIETIGHLKKAGMKPPVCIGIHPVLTGKAYEKLLKAGAGKVVTCN